MSTRSQTLSSIDTIPSADTFEVIYSLMNKLKEGTTQVRDGLKACNKRLVDVELEDCLFEPKPHAVAWFKKHKIETPCDLETFLKAIFSELGAKRRVCHRTRTILLEKEQADLFRLEPNEAYRWIEVLEKLPNVFC